MSKQKCAQTPPPPKSTAPPVATSTADEVHRAAAVAKALVSAVEMLVQVENFPAMPPSEFRQHVENFRRWRSEYIALPMSRVYHLYNAEAIGHPIKNCSGNSLAMAGQLADEMRIDLDTAIGETHQICVALAADVAKEPTEERSDGFYGEVCERFRQSMSTRRNWYPTPDEFKRHRSVIGMETDKVLSRLGHKDPQSPPTQEINQEDQAIALLMKPKEYPSLAAIAKCVGVDRKTLYKWKRFLECAERAGLYSPKTKDRGNFPRGFKSADGTVEPWCDPDK